MTQACHREHLTAAATGALVTVPFRQSPTWRIARSYERRPHGWNRPDGPSISDVDRAARYGRLFNTDHRAGLFTPTIVEGRHADRPCMLKVVWWAPWPKNADRIERRGAGAWPADRPGCGPLRGAAPGGAILAGLYGAEGGADQPHGWPCCAGRRASGPCGGPAPGREPSRSGWPHPMTDSSPIAVYPFGGQAPGPGSRTDPALSPNGHHDPRPPKRLADILEAERSVNAGHYYPPAAAHWGKS